MPSIRQQRTACRVIQTHGADEPLRHAARQIRDQDKRRDTANPPLAVLLGETIGGDWLRHLKLLSELNSRAENGALRERLRVHLSDHMRNICSVTLVLTHSSMYRSIAFTEG